MSQILTEDRGVFASIIDALRGDTHRDFTRESIGRAITLLAIPMVLEMAMESLFAVVDMFWVAHLGADAVATVGLTEAVETLIYSVSMGLSVATTALVSRRIGEHNPEDAARAGAQSMLLGIAIGALSGITGAFFAPTVLRLMGAPDSIVVHGAWYPRLIFASSPVILLLFSNNAIFRGAGDAALAMRVLWVANLINIVLNPLLIFGLGPFPRMGVAGSGAGTTIGRSVGVLLQFWMLARGSSRVVITLRRVKMIPAAMRQLLRLSLGGIFQYLVGTASWIVLVRMVAAFGPVAVAGYTVAMRIFLFAILPSWGLAGAAATLVGQNLGARQPERAEQSVWRAGFYNMIFLGLVAVIFVICAVPLVSLFSSDSGVILTGSRAPRIISYGYISYAWGMVAMQAFNGAGDTYTPTMISLGTNWMLQMPAAWFLAFRLGTGPNGVFAAIAGSASVYAVVAVILLRRGSWKQRRV
ncbi:MAG TPA: MATE family efflux transporter [Bryobacteraceae bacterium]|nr:MATE family efflux transporter [Bryobacteraceae bacterium]